MESATTPEPTVSEDEQTEPELSAGSSAPAPVQHINILVEGNTATFGTLWDLEDCNTTMSLAEIRQLMMTSFAETIAEWFDDGFRFVRKTSSGISPVHVEQEQRMMLEKICTTDSDECYASGQD